MFKQRVLWGLTGILLSCAQQLLADSVSFDTTPLWNGSATIQPFGVLDTTTYGETFVAPAADVLQDFSFYLQGDSNVHLSMKAYVFAWDGSLFGGGGGGATGPALYSSPSSIIFNGGSSSSLQAVQVNTGGVKLTPGNSYVMLLTISNSDDFAVSTGWAQWALAGVFDHVANDGGGGFVFDNNGNDFAALNTTPWNDYADFGDLAFKADFTCTPEPSAIIGLSGLALAGLLGYAWRRRKQTA